LKNLKILDLDSLNVVNVALIRKLAGYVPSLVHLDIHKCARISPDAVSAAQSLFPNLSEFNHTS